MDDGYEIPRLNENWTFAGATPMEWASGLVSGILFQELFIANLGQSMPIFVAIVIGIPVLMATARKSFPDEERGVRNHVMVAMGVPPTGIPTPSKLQPVWSGLPMQQIDKNKEYAQLDLDKVIHFNDPVNTEEENY
jgi:hypothetical protein